MATVKDVLEVLRNPDKSTPEEYCISDGNSKNIFPAKSALLSAFNDFEIDSLSFDGEKKLWIIRIAVKPE